MKFDSGLRERALELAILNTSRIDVCRGTDEKNPEGENVLVLAGRFYQFLIKENELIL